jgi:hypothetical protein
VVAHRVDVNAIVEDRLEIAEVRHEIAYRPALPRLVRNGRDDAGEVGNRTQPRDSLVQTRRDLPLMRRFLETLVARQEHGTRNP